MQRSIMATGFGREIYSSRSLRILCENVELPTLSLPVDTELDIEVDVQEEQVSFVIRDRETGEVLRTIPEGDAADLVNKLRDFHGGLVDRSL